MSDKEEVLFKLRDAIQEAEKWGLVRTEDGTVITGAIVDKDGGITLVEE
ncbi:hypothetical protein PQC39_gp022 [Vibrio phage Vp_R1]|uniref:Uncharacterized protein n=1 Tax=Vibrio phage Vp_R1 TaxID=2059867 RepID=A0A2H5BQG4_9CAUD|nr:hypothetical protein PQC39_gp022 [Vibrio phage Vp_R1]AUG88386.1 hypothetical protein VPR_022 [Vibrio phage Vp_R1]